MKYIVSHKYRFVYFVVPKAACTSIKTALIPVFNLSEEGYWRKNQFGELRLQVHDLFDNSPNQINRKRLEAIWGKQLHTYTKFTFVRNPWDRLVSCWTHKFKDRIRFAGDSYLKPVEPPANKPDLFDFEMSFEEFAKAVSNTPDEYSDIHFRSQYTILQSSWKQQNLLPNFIGKVENIDDDFAKLASKLKLEDTLKLDHMMKSRSREFPSYRDYYDDTLRALIAARYARDIHEFGYTF